MTTGKIECLCTYYWHQFPYVTGHFCRGEEMDDVSDEYLRTHLHAKCDYMSRQTLVPAKWSMQENRYVPSSP